MNPLMKAFLKAFVAGHVAVYRFTSGRFGARIGTRPVALITTTGRKTGKKRTVPVASFEDQGDAIVVASFGGSPEHPAWYNNMVANPNVNVQIGERPYQARVEIVTGPDRERLWKMVVDQAPGFAAYQKKTTREIPIVRLKRL